MNAALVCLLVLLLSGIAGCLFPYFYDDAFISFRITENILSGNGPYFNKGQRVYTSTSLLYPFINIIPAWLGGTGWITFIPFLNAFWMGLSFCICFFQASRRFNDMRPVHFLAAVFLLLPWLFEQQNWIFGNSGLETGFYMAALAASLFIERFRRISPWLIFIRPDGWLAGLAVFADRLLKRDRPAIISMLWHLSLSLLAWLLMGWLIYGSAVPQSIIAKSLHSIDRINQIRIGFSYTLFTNHLLELGVFIAAFWLKPEFRNNILLPGIWAGLYLIFYSCLAAWWPWYLPPLHLAFWFMSLLAFFHLLKEKTALSRPALALLLISGFLFFRMVWKLHSQWPELKNSSAACSIRMEASRALAVFLSESTPKSGRVLLEPLGMVSWYGPDLKILDYPGLSSPEMTRLLATLNHKIPHRLTDSTAAAAIIAQFQPETIVLWREEWPEFQKTKSFRNEYTCQKKLPYYLQDKRMDSVAVFQRFSR